MYLGGLGGTGKSQVVKAILDFLEGQGRLDECEVLAPTGSAACIVNRSTYHSALKFKFGVQRQQSTPTRNTHIVSRFQAVKLIIIDEISMVSCFDFYEISRALSVAFKDLLRSFAGRHVLVAGDFGADCVAYLASGVEVGY